MGPREFDHIVIGVGGIGSAATYWLSRLSTGSVLGLERFELDHERGASRDHGRVIRYFYHSPTYIQMAAASFATFEEVAREARRQLIYMTGGVTFHPPGTTIPATDYLDAMTACNVPFEVLDPGGVRKRWPQFSIPDGVVAISQDDTGVVAAAAANYAHVALARQRGATVLERSAVTSIRPVHGEYEVSTGTETYRTASVVIATDAWTNELLAHFGLKVSLTVTREQVSYLAPAVEADFAAGRFPVWAWMDEATYYGLPAFGSTPMKASMDTAGPTVDPETRTFEMDEAYHERVMTFLARVIPGAAGRLLFSKTCLYAMTPDREFIVDELPDHPRVFVVQGAAHAFKFASLLGRTLAELATGRPPSVDISPFSIRRPVLAEARPTVNLQLRRAPAIGAGRSGLPRSRGR